MAQENTLALIKANLLEQKALKLKRDETCFLERPTLQGYECKIDAALDGEAFLKAVLLRKQYEVEFLAFKQGYALQAQIRKDLKRLEAELLLLLAVV